MEDETHLSKWSILALDKYSSNPTTYEQLVAAVGCAVARSLSKIEVHGEVEYWTGMLDR